jgi:hypothetical protein
MEFLKAGRRKLGRTARITNDAARVPASARRVAIYLKRGCRKASLAENKLDAQRNFKRIVEKVF